MTQQACGNSKCRASTGIHDGMTFGSGKLDHYGYWQFPCRPCAEQWDKNKEERIAQLKSEGFTDEVLNSGDYEWVTMPAWPYGSDSPETPA